MWIIQLIRALFLTPGPKYSWKKAAWVVLLSSLIVSGGATAGYVIYRYVCHVQANSTSSIQAIIQTGPKYAPLPTHYFAEVLDLSLDHPSDLNQFKLSEAYDRLQASCLFKQIRLQKIKPNVLFIDYTLKEPIAYLEDYSHTALDCEGFLFPCTFFYSPCHLPAVYLGVHAPPGPWGARIEEAHFLFVEEILNNLPKGSITRIDLSKVEAASSGKREIVLVLKRGDILRLTPKNYLEQLANYNRLRHTSLYEEESTYIVDLRIPDVAYLKRI